MPKYRSNFIDEIIDICQEEAPNNSCKDCVASVDECKENLVEAWKEYDRRNSATNDY